MKSLPEVLANQIAGKTAPINHTVKSFNFVDMKCRGLMTSDMLNLWILKNMKHY